MPDEADGLGGRLPLLDPHELRNEQRSLHELIATRMGREAAVGGFRVQLDDGRLIGPFNALLRVPAIATALAGWAGQIQDFGLDEQVRQVVILTIGAHWGAAFEVDAHRRAARAAGIPEGAVDAIVRGEVPVDLRADAALAHQLTSKLVSDHGVPDEVYARAVELFGEEGVVALLCLIGQYQTISGLLVAFRVPAPHG